MTSRYFRLVALICFAVLCVVLHETKAHPFIVWCAGAASWLCAAPEIFEKPQRP